MRGGISGGKKTSHRLPSSKGRSRKPCAFEAWLPILAKHALGRSVKASFHVSSDEMYSLARSVKNLSRGFTRSRELAGASYFSHPDVLAAYLLFFWPVSYEQALAVYKHFMPAPGLSGATVLDVGGGPGPAACAALDCGARRVVVADVERPALDMARTLIASRGGSVATCVWNAGRENRLPEGAYDLIVFSHVLNELWTGVEKRIDVRADVVESLAGRLSDRGRIVIIEPALLSLSRDLLRMRDLLRSRGFPVLSPCLRAHDCPCVVPGADQKATCHADMPWTPPSWYVRLAHRARIGKESLRFSFLVLGKPGAPVPAGDESVFRVVSERMLSKSGRMRYMICNDRGRFSLSAKPAGKESWVKTFLHLKRYDKVRVAGIEKRENGIGLTPASRLERIIR